MTAQITAQKISSYLTSNRFGKSNWRGTQAEYLLQWVEKSRIYNQISPELYSEVQLSTFLNAAVADTPNLATVYTAQVTARRAGGITTPMHFNEFTAELLQAAAVHDAAVSFKKP